MSISVAAGAHVAARALSGGNLQKFVIGRELSQSPDVIVINQPTWGVDAAAAAAIRQAILDRAGAGAANGGAVGDEEEKEEEGGSGDDDISGDSGSGSSDSDDSVYSATMNEAGLSLSVDSSARATLARRLLQLELLQAAARPPPVTFSTVIGHGELCHLLCQIVRDDPPASTAVVAAATPELGPGNARSKCW